MTDTFKLLGLNKRPTTGIYATVECGKEDWFHSDFDEYLFPIDRQNALFDYMKNPDQKFKGSTVVVEFDKWSTGNVPENPIIKDITIAEKKNNL